MQTILRTRGYKTVQHYVKFGLVIFGLNNQPTSFRFREAFVQMEDDFLNEVLNVAPLRTAYEHGPVMSEALGGRLDTHHRPMA